MFDAKFTTAYPFASAYTVGKVYRVFDADDWLGLYYVFDDNGDRKAVSWMRFEDMGHALTAYQRKRAA